MNEEEEEEEKEEYFFFPAERAESKENYQQQQLKTPVIETLPDPEADSSTSDLTHHLSSALNLATVTWTQDPYRAEEVSEGNSPTFDIDFSKTLNN